MASAHGALVKNWKMPSEKPTTLLEHDTQAFDVEVDMARALISSDPNVRPKHFSNFFEEDVFVFAIMMATASTTFLQGVIVINTATIGRDLIMNSGQVTWIASAIGLTNGSLVLFFGKTADLFGRKIQLLIGMILLSVFSLVTSFAPNATSMLVFCGFLGIGTAMIGPPAIGILLATYPEGQRRNRVTGALGAGNPVGFILGSVSSGLATKYWSWRSAFVVIAIFFLVMTTLVVWTVPTIPRAGNRSKMVRQFDYLGTGLMIVGMALISAALTEGPELGWNSFKVILMLLVGIFCIVGFQIWETIFPYPLLDPAVWSNRSFTLIVLSVSFGYMSFITNEFWIALWLQDIKHLAPLHIAALLLPQALAGVIWSYLGQALVSRISGTMIMAIGGFGYLAGAVLLIFIKEDSSYWTYLFPALCITVIGADFQFIVSNLYVSKQMPSQSSLAAGILQTGRSLSISIGLAITFAVYGSMAESSEGRSDPEYPYHRVYICTILLAVVSLLFIPFMKIEKQGSESTTPSIASSSTTAVNEGSPQGVNGVADGTGDNPDLHKENSHVLAQKPSEGSLASAATAGSADSFFPRWSWEQMKRWPDDRHNYPDDNVVYEVCIKCLQERRVLVQTEKEERMLEDEPSDIDHNVLWDVESQHDQLPINVPVETPGHLYLDGTRDSVILSNGTRPPSNESLQNLSLGPFRRSSQSWVSATIEQPHALEYPYQAVLPTSLQRAPGHKPLHKGPQEVKYDNHATGERVLLSGYPSQMQNTSVFQPTYSSRRNSNSPYRRSLVDGPPVPMPALPPPPVSMSTLPRGTRARTSRTSTQNSNQHQSSSYQGGDTSFEFPPSIDNVLASASGTPKGHTANRSISLRDQSPIKTREGFTSIELEREVERVQRESLGSAPSRVLNSREMAMHYSAGPMFKRGRRETDAKVIINPGGFDQRSNRGGSAWV